MKKGKFNGYIFVDPDLEIGNEVLLDGGDPVILVRMGKIFATVRHEDMEWSVMVNRLRAKKENDTTFFQN